MNNQKKVEKNNKKVEDNIKKTVIYKEEEEKIITPDYEREQDYNYKK